MTIFYSWQSDLPPKTNRNLIKNGLEKAVKSIIRDETIDVVPRIEHDTRGEIGSPSIEETIFRKIREATLFVADVSIVNRAQIEAARRDDIANGRLSEEYRPMPNPNVLTELGYAAAVLGWKRVLLVFNGTTGRPKEDLPFDICLRRAFVYRPKDAEGEEGGGANDLSKDFESIIRETIKKLDEERPDEERLSSFEMLIRSISSTDRDREALIGIYWTQMHARLQEVAPDLTNETDGKVLSLKLEAALTIALPLVIEFASLCEAVSKSEDSQAAEALTKGFDLLLAEYQLKAGGFSYYHAFDYWKFIGHEMYTVWIAILLRSKQWQILHETLTTDLYKETESDRDNLGYVHFDELSQGERVLTYGGPPVPPGQGAPVSRRANILKERYETAEMSKLVTWRDFIEADLFLNLACEIRWGHAGRELWVPFSSLYLEGTPKFIQEARSQRYADGLQMGLGAETPERMKSFMLQMNNYLKDLWRTADYYHLQIDNRLINVIGDAR